MAQPLTDRREADLLTAIDGPIARMTFNRPQVRNALTADMLGEMAEFLERAEADPKIRCIVMTGAGDHFMAGGDVRGFADSLEASPAARRADFERRAGRAIPVFEAIARLTKPLVAKVRGAAAGASISWIAAADFVLVSDTAFFVFAHIGLGLSPDGGLSLFLPRVIGLRKAKELILLGGRLEASQAVAVGLANRLVPDADLDGETESLCRRLAAAPAEAFARSKRLLARAGTDELMAHMALEAESFGACAATEDFAEGVRAFLEKRKPVFGTPGDRS